MDRTRKVGLGMQKCQALFLRAAYAILKASRMAEGDLKTNFVHALVLMLAGNREFNLKRRDLLKPDLNTQFSTLCSVSTLISTGLFGYDVGKEIDEVAKANKLRRRLGIPKRGRGSRCQPYNRQGQPSIGFHQQRGRFGARGFTRIQSFFELTTCQQASYLRDINAVIVFGKHFKAG